MRSSPRKFSDPGCRQNALLFYSIACSTLIITGKRKSSAEIPASVCDQVTHAFRTSSVLLFSVHLAADLSLDVIMGLQISTLGYSTASVAFLVLTVLLIGLWRDRLRGNLLPTASMAGAAWGAALAYSGTLTDISIFQIFLIEIFHDSVWLFFLSSVLAGAVSSNTRWRIRYGGVLIGTGLLAAGVLLEYSDLKFRYADAQEQLEARFKAM